MDRLLTILANLGDIGNLPDRELEQLRVEIMEASAEAREGTLTAQTTQALQSATEAMESIRSEQTTRTEIAAQLQADADAAMERMNALNSDGDEAGDGEAEGEAAEGDAAEGDGAAGDDYAAQGRGLRRR